MLSQVAEALLGRCWGVAGALGCWAWLLVKGVCIECPSTPFVVFGHAAVPRRKQRKLETMT